MRGSHAEWVRKTATATIHEVCLLEYHCTVDVEFGLFDSFRYYVNLLAGPCPKYVAKQLNEEAKKAKKPGATSKKSGRTTKEDFSDFIDDEYNGIIFLYMDFLSFACIIMNLF